MRILKIHLVYGEDTEASMATPLCIPIASAWFSVSVPAGQLMATAELTLAEFQDQLADMMQDIQDIQEAQYTGSPESEDDQ